MHRVARQHQTMASAKHAATNSEEWWEHRPGDRVRTIDGPGRVTAVNDGPFPGAEEYQVELEGGLGGGAYQPGQITKMLPTMASTEHTADIDYPELGTLLHDRPDPASLSYTAAYQPDVPGANGSQGPFEREYTLPHVYARDIHSGAGNCVCGAGMDDTLHTEIAPGVEPRTADLVGSGDSGSSMTPGATVSDEGNDNGSWPPEYNNALYHRRDDIPKVVASSLPSIEAISDERRKELRDQATDPKHYKELLRGEIAKEREDKQRADEFLNEKFGPEMPTPRSYHPAWGGATPQDDLFGRLVGTEPGVSQDVEDAREDRQSLHSLNHLLVTASMDPEFRFHFTAAWADVRAKAKRIRAEGGVNITHADDLMVVGNVRGDHHVYETGLQRHPGRRSSVAVYSCGCKWGAYHWGAPDDLSRFAGRMCSHALALQFEAQSRGMFGHDVEVDDAPAKWVPSRVVVKYDIDDRDNLYARAALRGVPRQAPHLVALAALEDDDPALHAILAATNELFGGGVVESNPTNMNIYGPTVPRNPDESPASAGPFAGGLPSDWGAITTNMLARTRVASAMQSEGFWHVLAESLMGEEGAEATLHEEPQGALPETDGHVHLATPDEARDEDYTPEQRDLDPLVASLDDVELTEHTPDVADNEPQYQSIQTQGAEMTNGAGIGSAEGTDVEELGAPEAIDVLERTGSVGDVVAEFQKSAGAQALRSGSSQSGGGQFDDIAGAAEAYLTKTAASFSAAERQALIHESPGTQASNTDRLDIEGTHYALLEDEAADEGWLD